MTGVIGMVFASVLFSGAYTSKTEAKGFRMWDVDIEKGCMRETGCVDTIDNPTYMALTKDSKRVYVACSLKEIGGAIVAYDVEGGNVVELDRIATGTSAPCHVSLAPDGKAVVFAAYGEGKAGAVDLDANGRFVADSLRVVRNEGTLGPRKDRQESAHAHFAAVTPDGKYLQVVDLGLDEVKAYEWASHSKGLREVKGATIKTPAGYGPRHLVWQKNGKVCYVIFELANKVASYMYDGKSFTMVSVATLLPDGFSGFSKAAAIKLSDDGKKLFCSNRGYDSIAVFETDPESGSLKLLNIAMLDGAYPRDFEFAPDGRHCVIGLKMSDKIELCEFDGVKNDFVRLQTIESVYRPLFFKFVK